LRSSQDATAAIILAEENVVMAKGAKQELFAQVQKLQESQHRQTEVLGDLLTSTDFGLLTMVLNDTMPSGQAWLDLLDLPGSYSRLIRNLREPTPHHTPNTPPPIQCNTIALNHHNTLNIFYHPLLALASHPTHSLLWPTVFTRTDPHLPPPLPLPLPLRQERQQTARQEERQERQDPA
jgi:hypothetical protein